MTVDLKLYVDRNDYDACSGQKDTKVVFFPNLGAFLVYNVQGQGGGV